ncbi:MAG: hypothetical protein AVO35_04495 [Candidatus Aegiribacteria sp. MLS_C]|nr:MAG: hypothetical protein AVO35_04495 [Candidatus Aegiribacteria sp. MLS_C]
MNREERTVILLERLPKMYPDARCLLEYDGSAERLLISTILSARTTDDAVNRVAPLLWSRVGDLRGLAGASRDLVEDIVHPLGFFRSKAKAVQEAAAWVLDRGSVPGSMEELVRIPGVGRKTAGVVLGEVFGVPAIIVDTHVGRLAGRLDLARVRDPDRIEAKLRSVVPMEAWTSFSHQLGFHGRRVCTSRAPDCTSCGLNDVCPRRGVPG